MRWLELKVPPVLLFLVALVTISLLHIPQQTHQAILLLSIVLVLLGVITGVAGVVAFRRARTTVNPLQVEKASALVTRGIFRFSRNPMYLGLLLGLCGAGVYSQHPLAILVILGFYGYLTRFQIIPEERAIEAIFGAEYKHYCHRVRRWL